MTAPNELALPTSKDCKEVKEGNTTIKERQKRSIPRDTKNTAMFNRMHVFNKPRQSHAAKHSHSTHGCERQNVQTKYNRNPKQCVQAFALVFLFFGAGPSPIDLMRVVRLVEGAFPSRRLTLRGGFLVGSFVSAPHTGMSIGQDAARPRYLEILNRLLISARTSCVFPWAAAEA